MRGGVASIKTRGGCCLALVTIDRWQNSISGTRRGIVMSCKVVPSPHRPSPSPPLSLSLSRLRIKGSCDFATILQRLATGRMWVAGCSPVQLQITHFANGIFLALISFFTNVTEHDTVIYLTRAHLCFFCRRNLYVPTC